MPIEKLGIVEEGERRRELYARHITRQVDAMRDKLIASLATLVREVVESEMQSLAERRAEKIKGELLSRNGKSFTVDQLKEAIHIATGHSWEEIVGNRRQNAVAMARHFAFYIFRKYRPDFSSIELGLMFGGRDHTTILHGLNRTIERMSKKPVSDWFQHPAIQALEGVSI
jgi:chromosomal replication initiator protein